MCCGQHKSEAVKHEPKAKPEDYFIRPSEQCVMCAEKHISTAYALSLECGYETPNRQRITGELTCASLHLYRDNLELSNIVRGVRHLIQERKESEIDWHPLLTAIDWLATSELDKEKTP